MGNDSLQTTVDDRAYMPQQADENETGENDA